MTSPNEGETVHQGTPGFVTWSVSPAVQTGEFRIWVYDTRAWHELTTTPVPVVAGRTDYTFEWNPAQPTGSNYRVLIWYRDGLGNWVTVDQSNVGFTIAAP